jgi:hypothetical protein
MNRILKQSVLSVAIIGIIGMAGCGGGGSSGGGGGAGSSQLTSGAITGFGSVFVDGVEFETDGGTTYSLDDGDDGPESEDELEVGMVVMVTGTVNPDGVTGIANHIEYDDALEGIVLSEAIDDVDGTGTLNVMGQTVMVDALTLFESDVAAISRMGDIAADNVVEVSGYASGDGTIYATRVEVELASHAGEEIEVKGFMEDLTATTFRIGSLTVDFSSAVLKDIPGDALAAGLYVEVKSTQGFNGLDQLVASKVELEDGGDRGFAGDDGDEVELNGTVTRVTPPDGTPTEFEVGGRRVLIAGATEIEHGSADDIVVGVHLEIEGVLDDSGALLADEIELGQDSNIEMKGRLEGVSGTGAEGTVTLFGQPVEVNTNTIMIDEQDEGGLIPEHFFSLEDLVEGMDYLEIAVHRDPDTGNLVADKLERDEDEETGQIEGPVEGIPDVDHLIIAGVSVVITGLDLPPVEVGDEVEVNGSYNIGTEEFTAVSVETDE